jgi:anti-sigma B factor antagonist
VYPVVKVLLAELIEHSSPRNPLPRLSVYGEIMKPEPSVPDASLPCVPAGPTRRNENRLKLRLEAGTLGGSVVLHCQGRILFHGEAQALATMVAEVLPSAHRMVIDLAGIDSIDSVGLGELVLTHMWAEAAGYGLKFACPKKSVRYLFEATNLVSLFDIYPSVPEAVAAMTQEEIHSS